MLGTFALVGPSRPALAQADNAQTTNLSAADIATIQVAVQTALDNVDPNLTGAARTAAITQALQQVAAAQIALSGVAALSTIMNAAILASIPAPLAVAALLPAATNAGVPAPTAVAAIALGAVSAGASATQTTQAIIAVAAQIGTSSAAVGNGLGQAAATFSLSNNAGAASQVALVVSNEGTLGTGQAFGNSVVAAGGSQQLASSGQQNPNAASLTGTTGTTATLAVANATTTTGGASQQVSSVGTTISCNNPSCN
jgi:hypothetical protein